MALLYIRDPIHGFIDLDDWEKEIIDHPVFQRLRRIKQLGWTDMVYPGACHSRFEHSLGVMHIATRMFDMVRRRNEELLIKEIGYTVGGLDRTRALVRICALLHDLGHAPFSHAAEDLMPTRESGKLYKHEDYSAESVGLMEDVINHELNHRNYRITVQEIKDFLTGNVSDAGLLLWRDLLASQIDADRADYLLRDSCHMGVAYGHYDLERLLSTLTLAFDPDTDSPILAVEHGGWHAAEGFILARYMMFTQVYFHKTRRAYDLHLGEAMKYFMKNTEQSFDSQQGRFPPPTSESNLRAYLDWTDWKVLGLLEAGSGGEHGDILRERKHYRRVFETPEVPEKRDLEEAEAICDRLAARVGFVDVAEKSWYNLEDKDVPVVLEEDPERVSRPLSSFSFVVRGLRSVKQTRIYVSQENRAEAVKVVKSVLRGLMGVK